MHWSQVKENKRDISDNCCCLPATRPCSVIESRDGGFPTLVSDYSEPRIYPLFLWSYYYRTPCPPLPPLDFPTREIPPTVLLRTPPVLPLHRIILSPGRLPSSYHHTNLVSYLHGVHRSYERPQYLILRPHILPSLAIVFFMLIPPTTTPAILPSSLLPWVGLNKF